MENKIIIILYIINNKNDAKLAAIFISYNH